MSKLQVKLSYGVNGEAYAMLEDDDGTWVDLGKGMTPRQVCNAAAKRLRQAAERFELLARQKEPFAEKTQAMVNRTRIPAWRVTLPNETPKPLSTRAQNVLANIVKDGFIRAGSIGRNTKAAIKELEDRGLVENQADFNETYTPTQAGIDHKEATP